MAGYRHKRIDVKHIEEMRECKAMIQANCETEIAGSRLRYMLAIIILPL
jgi:hypothetical protein